MQFPADDGIYGLSQLQSFGSDRWIFSRCPQDGANPASALVPPECALYVASSTSVTKLPTQATSYLALGPNLVFVQEGLELVSYNAASSYARNVLVRLLPSQGGFSSVEYLPSDGSILFVNARGDHGMVGLIRPGATRITWVDPTEDVVFGSAIFNPFVPTMVVFRKTFQRHDDFGNPTTIDERLFVCNVSTAVPACRVAAELLNMPSLDADAYGSRKMAFVAADVLVMPLTGATGFDRFMHVAAVNLTSQTVTDLFAGQSCDVTSYFASPAGLLLATHNCFSNTTETQGLSLHTIATGEVDIVVAGEYGVIAGAGDGSDYGSALLNDGSVVYFQASFNQNFAVYQKTADGKVQLLSKAPHPTAIPYQLPKLITYQTDFLIRAHLFLPDSNVFAPPYRTVIYTHGGPDRQMFPAPNPEIIYARRYAMNQYLASIGVAVLSINYRMGVGYGLDFQYCPKCGQMGGKEFDDVAAGAYWLLNQTWVKGPKVGIYGLSYGGLNALQAATRMPNVFFASVANAPVYNWVSESRFDGEFRTMNARKNNLAVGYGPTEDLANPLWASKVQANIQTYFQASPAAFMKQGIAPTLLIQGDFDQSVEVQATIDMFNQARQLGAPVSSLFFPNQVHGLSLLSSQAQAAQATVDFLLENPI